MDSGEIARQISDKALLIEVDVSNPKLSYVEELYEVTTVPYLIMVQGDKVLFKGIPTNESYKTVLSLLGATEPEIDQYQNVRDVLMMEVETEVPQDDDGLLKPCNNPEEYQEVDASNNNHMIQSAADVPEVLPTISNSP